MIGYDKQGFTAQSDPFDSIAAETISKVFPAPTACASSVFPPYRMCATAFLWCSRSSISGFIPTENDVASIVLTGTQAIEFIVVKARQSRSLRSGSDQTQSCKALLDQLLLCLCDCSFLLVQNGFLFAVCILYIMEDADIFKVQCFLDYLIGVDAPRTVGTVCFTLLRS